MIWCMIELMPSIREILKAWLEPAGISFNGAKKGIKPAATALKPGK